MGSDRVDGRRHGNVTLERRRFPVPRRSRRSLPWILLQRRSRIHLRFARISGFCAYFWFLRILLGFARTSGFCAYFWFLRIRLGFAHTSAFSKTNELFL